MKFAAMLAAVLFLAVAVPAADAAVEGALDTPEEPDIIELLYADLVLLNQYLTVFSGATINVPEMDKTQKAMILYALWNKDYELAARRAWNYVQSKALKRMGGATLGGFLTAVSLGEKLGISAHAWAGEGRLMSEMERLERDRGLEGWPRSYREAQQDGFLRTVSERIRPISLWLRDLDGGRHAPMTFDYYERLAYQLLLSLRDLELGYRRFGLEGADRTLENLERALREELYQAASQAAVENHVARYWEARRRAEEAQREAELQADRLRQQEEIAEYLEERRRLADERLKAEQAAAEAAAEAAAALEKLELLQEQLPEPDERVVAQGGEQGPLRWVVAPRLDGPEQTLFTISLTNISELPLRNLRMRQRPLGPVGPGGTSSAWGRYVSLLPGGSMRFTAMIHGVTRQMQIELFNESGTLASFILDALHGVPIARTEPEPVDDSAPAVTAVSDRLIDVIKGGIGHDTPVGPYGITGRQLALRCGRRQSLWHLSRLTGFKADGAVRPPPVWGTDVYAMDSSISAAAVHAGVLQPGQQGEAWVLVFWRQPPRYTGSSRYGIDSEERIPDRSEQAACFRFVIETGPCRHCPAVRPSGLSVWMIPGADRCVSCSDWDRLNSF